MQKKQPKILVLSFTIALVSSCGPDEEALYDEETNQQEILTKEGIDEALSEFETITYSELEKPYLDYSDPERKFENKLGNKTYHVVRGRDIFKYIVGEYRVKSFVPFDRYCRANNDDLDANKPQYWLVDKNMLYMVLEFILKLDELGYDKYGFAVRESHRHPLCNKLRGGASQSQHVLGTAADLVIKDINKDGEANQEDKEICLEILEEMIGERGGIGRYPKTMTIHIDCRGYGARWDSY